MSLIPQTSDSIVSPNFQLPFDIISDILSRLPVKPVLRFKSVCKTWYALIETPNFIKKHQIRSQKNSNLSFSSVLVTENILELRVTSMWLRCRHETHNPIPNFLFQHYPRVCGICDGLVCATLGRSETIATIICNPTTGKVRVLPEFSLPRIELDNEVFGFRFKDNDYNLYRIVHPPASSEFGFRVEVYSMNTNMWREIEVITREIDTRVRITRGFFDAMPVAINGVFYWKGGIDVSCVVSFDTNGYVFGMIICPEEIIRTYRCCWRIAELNEELVLQTNRYKWFELWVLNEKARSWTMKLKVEDLPSINHSPRMMGCDRNGNLVMLHLTPNNLDFKLFLYDPVSHEIMYLPFVGLKQRQEVYLYTESLLSV